MHPPADSLKFSSGAPEGSVLRWLETRILPTLVRLAGTPLVVAMQDSVISAIPFILIGFALFFWFPPEKYIFHQAASQIAPLVGGLFGAQERPAPTTVARALEAFRAGLGFMCLWVSFRCAWKLRKVDGENGLMMGFLSLLLFSLTFPRPMTYHDVFLYLAQGGLFVAILLAWGLVSLQKRIEFLIFRETPPYPPFPGGAGFLAFGCMAVGVFMLNHLLAQISVRLNLEEPLEIHRLVYLCFLPLMKAGDSPSVLLVILSMITLTMMGVHGSGVIGSIVLPIYFTLLQDNVAAYRLGQVAPHIVTPSFVHWCFLGGSGCTLPLCFFMLRARSARLRKLARVSLLPSICNINETLLFGIPLIMNPMTAIPFLLNPLMLCVVHYVELWLGFLHRTIIYVPFMIPAPINMWLASAGDWRAVAIGAIDFVACGAVWWPFFRAFDAKAVAEEGARD